MKATTDAAKRQIDRMRNVVAAQADKHENSDFNDEFSA